MDRKPHVLTGQTTLPQLLGLISLADLFISNDTGPMHLANALRVPVVAIFGPTDPAVTGPFEQPARVVKHDVPCWPCFYRKCPYDHRCMTTIPVEEVFLAGESLWQ
jgi:ADP-heptose:LPS heptosyltransferase